MPIYIPRDQNPIQMGLVAAGYKRSRVEQGANLTEFYALTDRHRQFVVCNQDET